MPLSLKLFAAKGTEVMVFMGWAVAHPLRTHDPHCDDVLLDDAIFAAAGLLGELSADAFRISPTGARSSGWCRS